MRCTSQSSARHLMAALLQVYHSYQSASHLPCATQPCLAPSALISFIIFQGRAGPLAASVAGSQSHDTANTAGFSIDHLLCHRRRCGVHPAPRPPTRAATGVSLVSVGINPTSSASASGPGSGQGVSVRAHLLVYTSRETSIS